VVVFGEVRNAGCRDAWLRGEVILDPDEGKFAPAAEVREKYRREREEREREGAQR
jgi:hypothetical protein